MEMLGREGLRRLAITGVVGTNRSAFAARTNISSSSPFFVNRSRDTYRLSRASIDEVTGTCLSFPSSAAIHGCHRVLVSCYLTAR